MSPTLSGCSYLTSSKSSWHLLGLCSLQWRVKSAGSLRRLSDLESSHAERDRSKYGDSFIFWKGGVVMLHTVFVPVQATKHNFELFFMGVEILSELLKVQHSVLVGVSSLNDLKNSKSHGRR